jgi:hypothetical protein
MTADEFRQLALSFPEAEERSHMNHPDFRVGGRIFASLTSTGDRGMVKISQGEQSTLTCEEPDVFEPANGAWGRQGCTYVRLAAADAVIVRSALLAAWRRAAPKRLTRER